MSTKKVINYYKLDMTPGSRKIRVNVSQNDTGMRRLIFGLHVSDRPWMIPSGCTVTISGRKPDGNVFAYEMDAEGCNASIVLQEQMTAVAGSTECAVSVADSSGIVYSCAFDLVVSRSVLFGGRTSQSDIPIMEQAIAAAGEALASAQLAEQHAENAETAAEEAAGSATTASDSATAASSSAATAQAAATRAEYAMNAARTAANDAAESATLAQTAMEESAANAQNAADSASAAADSATAAEVARAAIEADAPEVVAITIPEAKLWSAITAAQAAAGRNAAVDLTGATYDPEDAARIRAAYIAGKRVRFDLVMTTGTHRPIIASAENVHTATGARNYYTFRAAFDFAALGATSSIDGLKTLAILYVYDGSTNPATYSVSATVYAAGGYYDAENQLYVL